MCDGLYAKDDPQLVNPSPAAHTKRLFHHAALGVQKPIWFQFHCWKNCSTRAVYAIPFSSQASGVTLNAHQPSPWQPSEMASAIWTVPPHTRNKTIYVQSANRPASPLTQTRAQYPRQTRRKLPCSSSDGASNQPGQFGEGVVVGVTVPRVFGPNCSLFGLLRTIKISKNSERHVHPGRDAG